jgi:hypothetical protein
MHTLFMSGYSGAGLNLLYNYVISYVCTRPKWTCVKVNKVKVKSDQAVIPTKFQPQKEN